MTNGVPVDDLLLTSRLKLREAKAGGERNSKRNKNARERRRDLDNLENTKGLFLFRNFVRS